MKWLPVLISDDAVLWIKEVEIVDSLDDEFQVYHGRRSVWKLNLSVRRQLVMMER